MHRLELPEINVERAHTIIARYIDLSNLSRTEMVQLLSEVAWNGRSIQYFLRNAYQNTDVLTEAGSITMATIKEWTTQAYQIWSGEIAHSLLQIHETLHSQGVFMHLMLVFRFPEVFKATVTDGKVEIEQRFLPATWKNYSEAGAIQIMPKSSSPGIVVVHHPRGFLARFVTAKFKSLNANDKLQVFGWTIASLTEKIGSPGHLLERALAAGTILSCFQY